MPAVVRAVERFRPTRDEATYLEGVVRWILDGSAGDPRGFSSASLDIVSRVAELQQMDRQRGVPGWYLLDALRDYLIDRLARPRCADSTTEPMLAPAFNGVVGRLGAAREIDLIDATTVRPARLLTAARIDYYWQTPDSRRLHRDVERLRGDGKKSYTEAVKPIAITSIRRRRCSPGWSTSPHPAVFGPAPSARSSISCDTPRRSAIDGPCGSRC